MTLSVAQSRSLLQQVGLRRTSSRVAVLRYLASAKRPMTHAEATTDLVPRGFDKSTIYRALVEMSEAGIVSRLDVGDHIWRFELRAVGKEQQPAAGQGTSHPHFMCLDCGTVACLPESSVRISTNRSRKTASPGLQPAEITEILLKGRCRDCA